MEGVARTKRQACGSTDAVHPNFNKPSLSLTLLEIGVSSFTSGIRGYTGDDICLYSHSLDPEQDPPMMPLYYLHIRNRNKLEVDPDGMDLPDIDAALTEALQVARELTAEIPDYDGSTVIEIADGDGQTILTVPFSHAFCPKH
jgi:hypothetical protein